MNVNVEYNNENASNPTVFDRLLESAMLIVAEIERNRAPVRNEKYRFEDFFRTLAFYFVSGMESITILFDNLKKGLVDERLKLANVPRSTFGDAFERFDAGLFRQVYSQLLKNMDLKEIPELALFGTVCLVDGSLFPILNSMLWADYKTNIQSVRLHLSFELNRMTTVDFAIGAGKSCERSALKTMLKAGVTYVADRGYQCFKLFGDITAAEAHFIIRIKENTKFVVRENMTVRLPDSVASMFKDVTDRMVT